MKRVWILNHYAADPGGVGGTRHFHIAEYLKPLGWDATVIGSSVELNTGRQRLNDSEARRVDVVDGVRFLWIRVPEYAGNGGGRLRNMLAYSWNVLRKSTTEMLERPDVVVGSSVHPFAAVSAAFLARRFGVPFVFEVRDLWPQTLVDLGRLKAGSPIVHAMRLLERWLYRRATRIVTLLPRASEYIVPMGVEASKIDWIPNGVDLKLFPKMADAPLEGPFTVMYFGAHGQANSLDVLIDAMALVRDKCQGIRLRMVGDGLAKDALVVRARDLGLDASVVSFEPQVKKSQIPELAATANAFVIHVPSKPDLYRYGISPNKIFDYLAAGRPLIMGSDPDISMADEARCGITVKPGESGQLADAIIAMAGLDADVRRNLGNNGRAHVEDKYSMEYLAKQFRSVLERSIESHQGSK